jgi:hypothetical protein
MDLAGTGKELMLTVEVLRQRNDPPRAYSYADIFGMRTVEVDFLLAGESVASFSADKRRRFETILQSVMDQDPTVAVLDDGVHILQVTKQPGGKSSDTHTHNIGPQLPLPARHSPGLAIEALTIDFFHH